MSLVSRSAALVSRSPSLIGGVDVLVLCAGLPVGHRLYTGRWLVPETTEAVLAMLLVLGLYLAAIAAGGGYAGRADRPPREHLRRVGAVLGGAWVLVLVLAVARPSVALPSGTLAVHGLLAVAGVLGTRVLFVSLGLKQGAPPSTPPPSSEADARAAADGRAVGGGKRDVRLEDLVPRAPLEIDDAALREQLSDRTVLVTGAGGSVGSALSAQLLELSPRRLVLLDVSEHNLYRLKTALEPGADNGDLAFRIGDVRHRAGMDALLRCEQPDVVVHAAAYKHVHLTERHPAQTLRNNTLATAHLLRLCEEHGTEDFVFVSTDKAVHPNGVLGATKQWAEWYVRTAASSMRSRTVRFGNVFGSQGSVVPRFEEKLAAGEPLPVTHPEMERYFMTADEACRLLLQTLLFDTYPVYLLRMGDPVRIQWLAERLIERWYPQIDPASMIEHVGPRPGEKLREDLVRARESAHATDHPSIRGLEAPAPYARDTLDAYFRDLRALADPDTGSATRLRRRLLRSEPAVRSASA